MGGCGEAAGAGPTVGITWCAAIDAEVDRASLTDASDSSRCSRSGKDIRLVDQCAKRSGTASWRSHRYIIGTCRQASDAGARARAGTRRAYPRPVPGVGCRAASDVHVDGAVGAAVAGNRSHRRCNAQYTAYFHLFGVKGDPAASIGQAYRDDTRRYVGGWGIRYVGGVCIGREGTAAGGAPLGGVGAARRIDAITKWCSHTARNSSGYIDRHCHRLLQHRHVGEIEHRPNECYAVGSGGDVVVVVVAAGDHDVAPVGVTKGRAVHHRRLLLASDVDQFLGSSTPAGSGGIGTVGAIGLILLVGGIAHELHGRVGIKIVGNRGIAPGAADAI